MNFPELYCYLNKLKIQLTNLEKAEDDFINFIENTVGGTVRDERDTLTKIRQYELCYIQKEISDTMSFLTKLKSNIFDNKLEDLDLLKLKHDMLTLETKNNNLKREIDVELTDLNKLETALSIEVTNIEMKLSEIFKQDNVPYKKTNLIKNVDEHHLCGEAKRFLTFLNENGGHEGGWSNEDNIIFAKLYNKIKNKNALLQSLQKLFPEMTKEHILKHIDWYETYSELRNRQRVAIEKWRQEKSQKEPPKLEEKTEKKEKNDATQNQILKDKVQKWKQERQQKIEKDAKIKNDNANKFIEAQKQKLLKNQSTKEQVKRWKTEKEAREQAEKIAKEISRLRERERRMLMANKLIKEFRNQDSVYIAKKLQSKTNNEPQNNLPIKRVKSVPRKPERLFKPTKQWLAKTSVEDIPENMFSKTFSVKKIPKLGTPAWRTVS